MERPGGAPGDRRRSWLKPGTWHLPTRLVLVAMALLVAICAAVGIFSYASMDSFLTRQLDERHAGLPGLDHHHRVTGRHRADRPRRNSHHPPHHQAA